MDSCTCPEWISTSQELCESCVEAWDEINKEVEAVA